MWGNNIMQSLDHDIWYNTPYHVEVPLTICSDNVLDFPLTSCFRDNYLQLIKTGGFVNPFIRPETDSTTITYSPTTMQFKAIPAFGDCFPEGRIIIIDRNLTLPPTFSAILSNLNITP
jgi:hypothetical protein